MALLLAVALLAPLPTSLLRPNPVVAVTFAASDRIMAPPRGTPEKALHFAQARRSSRITEVYAYLQEVYRLAPLVGMDPAIVVAQSAHETGDWTSFYWKEHLNPAGIGITSSGVPSATWASGTHAARGQIVHLYLYAVGPIPETHRLYPYISLDPRYSAAMDAGYAGTAPTLNDLTGRWATDPQYGVNVARRGNEVFLVAATDPVDPALAVQRMSTSGGTSPLRSRDGDPTTGWELSGSGGAPPEAWLVYDLGAEYRLSTIQWLFSSTGNADSWELQLSSDGASWRMAGRFSNATAGVWSRYRTVVTGRYVRFLFTNPNGDMTLGSLGEVEFYGGLTSTSTATATATATPTVIPSPITLTGSRLRIVGGGGSNIGNGSWRVRDRDIRTTWQTITSTPPRRAQVYVDLGATGSITGVEWLFRRTSGAASYSIQVSNDKRVWITVSKHAGSTPLAWQRIATQQNARYVRFLFTNPTNAPALGYLAELRVYGAARSMAVSEDQPSVTPTRTPTTTASLTAGTPASTATTTATAESTMTPIPTETPTATPITTPDEPTPSPSPALDASPFATP